MRILCVATKCPWPPRDGGRLVLSLTLQGFIDAGHEVTVIVPDEAESLASAGVPGSLVLQPVRVRRRGWIEASLRALGDGRTATLVRHDQPALRQAVADCVAHWRPHVVHAEQLQSMTNCTPAAAAGVPIALRMQNVESALWEQLAASRFPAMFWRRQARRLRAAERTALAQAATTITLTAADADALASLGHTEDRTRIACIEPAFPATVPAGAAVAGDPALVLAGSGWWPNAQGQRWFLGEVWPLLRAELPQAQLHVFGGAARTTRAGMQWHAAPAQSQTAFPQAAIAIVPLLAAGGIRMRILEAWARGLPVIATSIAVRGLDVVLGRELLVADSPQEFLDAVLRVRRDFALRQRLIDNGRAYLRRHHDPVRQTAMLLARYAAVSQG